MCMREQWIRMPQERNEEGNKCSLFPLAESLGGLFIGEVRGFGNNVRTAPLTTPFTLST
jgi:hypothetical protein